MNTLTPDNSTARIECVRELPQFWALEPLYRRLYQESESHNPFLSWEWLASWVEIYQDRIELAVYLVHYFDETIGILPLYRMRPSQSVSRVSDQLRFLGDQYVSSEYLDLIAAPQHVMLVTQILLTQILLSTNHSTSLFLDDVAETSPLLINLSRLSRKHGFLYSIQRKNVCPVLDLQESEPKSESVCQQYKLGAAKLQQLLKKFGGQVELVENISQVSAQLDELFILHQKNWQGRGENGSFINEQKRQFYHLFASRFYACGWLNMFSLRISNTTVAAFIGFTSQEVFYFLQSGTDPEWGKYSVGTVAFYQILQALQTRGVRWVDFLRGNEAYKYRWGARARFTYSLQIYPASLQIFPTFLYHQAKVKVKSVLQFNKWGKMK